MTLNEEKPRNLVAEGGHVEFKDVKDLKRNFSLKWLLGFYSLLQDFG